MNAIATATALATATAWTPQPLPAAELERLAWSTSFIARPAARDAWSDAVLTAEDRKALARER